VVDVLVAANVLFGVGLLLLAIYIPGPTAFASFPSVLLLSTLFRLSLSIAITRLILLEADAVRGVALLAQDLDDLADLVVLAYHPAVLDKLVAHGCTHL